MKENKSGHTTVKLSVENSTRVKELAKLEARTMANFVNILVERTYAGYKAAQQNTA